MNHASFLSRLAALILDFIIIFFIGSFLVVIFGAFVALFAMFDNAIFNFIAGMISFMFFVVLALLNFFYFGYFWSKDGQTAGMKLANIKVVRQGDQPLSFLRAGLRGTVGYWISGLIFNLGFIWAAIDHNKETWHDKLFDTWVVRADSSTPSD